MLDAAQTAEAAVHHDGHSGAQSFTFLHAEGKYHRLSQVYVKNHISLTQDCILSRSHTSVNVEWILPVWGKHDGAALFDDAMDAVPQRPPGFGVHASGGFIL